MKKDKKNVTIEHLPLGAAKHVKQWCVSGTDLMYNQLVPMYVLKAMQFNKTKIINYKKKKQKNIVVI